MISKMGVSYGTVASMNLEFNMGEKGRRGDKKYDPKLAPKARVTLRKKRHARFDSLGATFYNARYIKRKNGMAENGFIRQLKVFV